VRRNVRLPRPCRLRSLALLGARPAGLAADAAPASGDAWALRIELPPGSRIEYKLEIGQDGRVEWILDLLNPVVATDPFGANPSGYGYVRPP
jgi:hypothetical protein